MPMTSIDPSTAVGPPVPLGTFTAYSGGIVGTPEASTTGVANATAALANALLPFITSSPGGFALPCSTDDAPDENTSVGEPLHR